MTVAKLAASQPDRNLRGEVEILVCHQRMLAIALRGGRLRDTRRTRRVVEQLARIVDRGEPPPLERVLGARVTGWAEFAHNGTGVREWRVSRT